MYTVFFFSFLVDEVLALKNNIRHASGCSLFSFIICQNHWSNLNQTWLGDPLSKCCRNCFTTNSITEFNVNFFFFFSQFFFFYDYVNYLYFETKFCSKRTGPNKSKHYGGCSPFKSYSDNPCPPLKKNGYLYWYYYKT